MPLTLDKLFRARILDAHVLATLAGELCVSAEMSLATVACNGGIMTDDPQEQAAQRRLGTWLRGKYRLDRVLGVGGMAVVYAATHRNGHRVAIKMLHAALSLDGDLVRRFLDEGHKANAVDHPGVVKVTDDDCTEDGAAFVVMELLDGATLEALRENSGGTLEPVPVAAVAVQLLDVLAVAHVRGLIHRDIKPDNIFVTRAGEVKVLDFGIARLRDGAPGARTATGLAMGTPAFMAPEQAFGKMRDIDARTDVYAVGATMFSCLTSQCVHVGETAAELVIRAATVRALRLEVVMPEIWHELADLVDRATAFAREERWQSASAMRDAATAVLRALAPDVDGREVLRGLVTRLAPPRPSDPLGDLSVRPSGLPPVGSADIMASTLGHSTPLQSSNVNEFGGRFSTPSGSDAYRLRHSGGTAPLVQSFAPPSNPGSTTAATNPSVISGGPSKKPDRRGLGRWLVVGLGGMLLLGALYAAAPLARHPLPAKNTDAAGRDTSAATVTPIVRAAMAASAGIAEDSAALPSASSGAVSVSRAASQSPPRPPSAPTKAPAAPRVPASSAPATARPTAPAKPNCDIPFYVDSQGIQRIRPECE